MNLQSTHNKVHNTFMIVLVLKVSQKGFKKSQWYIQVQVKTERAVGLPAKRNRKVLRLKYVPAVTRKKEAQGG